MILRAAKLKVRLTDLENRVAVFLDADTAAGAFVAINENLSELETRLQLLDPDRLYLNVDCVTNRQFNLNAEKKVCEAILSDSHYVPVRPFRFRSLTSKPAAPNV
jgi:hypothetical protein